MSVKEERESFINIGKSFKYICKIDMRFDPTDDLVPSDARKSAGTDVTKFASVYSQDLCIHAYINLLAHNTSFWYVTEQICKEVVIWVYQKQAKCHLNHIMINSTPTLKTNFAVKSIIYSI